MNFGNLSTASYSRNESWVLIISKMINVLAIYLAVLEDIDCVYFGSHSPPFYRVMSFFKGKEGQIEERFTN